MDNVNLLNGIFKQSQEKGEEYLHYLDIDRLVAPCYEANDQAPKKPRYGGWEKEEIAGHSIGHWLSAAASMYATTWNTELKQKLDYAIDELGNIQYSEPKGYVSGFPRTCFDNVFNGDFQVDNFSLGGSWVPWYSIHKIFAGLIDTYKYTGNRKALDIVLILANWAKNGLGNLTDEQFEKMLICEHGGMNEVMADVYILTNNKEYLDLAKRFCHHAILTPLSEGIDDLEGKHANTQIPKVIGAAKIYDITGEKKYKDLADFFWKQVTNYRSYVIGGNSIGEHFGSENEEELGITTAETCNTYNMLKLTEHLFHWFPKAEYMEYYEKALYNHILPSQDPDTGMKTYFVSTQPGHFKVYCTPDNSFWCCTGSGMENPARYTRNIYYQEQGKLYVNLFIASEINMEDKNMKLRQETSFPESQETKLIITKGNNETLPIHVRIPQWAKGEVIASVNGNEHYSRVENGYLIIKRRWVTGDSVKIKLPMELYTYKSKDDPKKQVIMYGPLVMAGALGKENFPETDIVADHQALNDYPLIDVPTLLTDRMDVNKWITPEQGSPLTFKTDPVGQPGNVNVTLIPFYKLHHQRYTLYWDIRNDSAE
ncbi:DUF1680 family protein [Virgibacillus natechei]|uniref:DUF1680 family protein n=1 Tax=Virgibacillus natechei TaxID=1216297 RepID=A0ABS4IEC4_9BACI|nr:glycoside hydrolase family 127 protein [Virgibacillus natechei]MBP1969282.1 DUF1680 family protein [Virgibacillus natechei]UZD12437.1 glycoside hydrolase family 127 protein [Virgibacillus natechei]